MLKTIFEGKIAMKTWKMISTGSLAFATFALWCAPHAQSAEVGLLKSQASLRSWVQTTAFNGPRTSLQSVVWKDFVYVLGGYFWDAKANKLKLFNDVQYALLQKDGSIDPRGWKRTEPFITARLGHGSVVHKGFLYVIAGGDGANYLNDTEWAKLNPDGSIASGAWVSSPFKLNVPRSNPGVAIFEIGGKTFLYAVGGVGDVNGKTVHFDTVEYTPINADGSVGKWVLSDSSFENGRSSPGVVVIGNHLYAIGGWGDKDEDIYGDVQSAALKADGSVGKWTKCVNSLNIPRYGHGTILLSEGINLSPLILVAGGNGGKGVYLNSIEYAAVEPQSGTVGKWIVVPAANVFSGPRWGHGAVSDRGFVVVIGGAGLQGAFLNDVQVAPVRISKGP